MERYARLIIGLVDEAVSAARFANESVDAPVKLGASTASADHALVPQLARLRIHRSALQFTLEIANRARVWQMLADRTIDVAITSRPPGSGAFDSVATRSNEFVVVAKPGLVWPGRLDGATWLVREEGSSTRAAADEVMTLLSISAPTIVIGSNAAIQRSVEAGLGVAVLPREAVNDSLRQRSLTLVRTDATPLEKPWHVIVRAGEPLNGPTKQFVCDLVEVGGEFSWTPTGSVRTHAGPR
jgi:LysR family transcriptional regulator, low CO2-responsive transcriptional regulator